MPRFLKGERVRHPQFGRGTIRELTGLGSDVKAVIDFESVGQEEGRAALRKSAEGAVMAVTPDEALHVAALARLRLDAAEVERFTEQLNSILSHMAELADADADGVDALAATADWNAPLRDDAPGGDSLRLRPSEMAPGWTAGFFTLPRLPALDGGTPGSNA